MGIDEDVLFMAFATSILAAVCLRAATVSVCTVVVPHFSFKYKLRPYIYGF